MNRYHLDYLMMAMTSLNLVMRDCQMADAMKKQEIGDDHLGALVSFLEVLETCMKSAEADRSVSMQIISFTRSLKNRQELRPSVVAATIGQVLLAIETTLQDRLFMQIPLEQARYWMNMEHFGESANMFPEALGDMLEAVNCYAAGRATACVFHSMRVAEHGLRHIAHQLEVSLTENGKPCDIEYGTWETVLRHIENKRTELRKESKDKAHEVRTIEYASLASTCAHLKDLWRNPVMHSRGLKSLPEALGAMTRVFEFMNRLAGSVYAPPVEEKTKLTISSLKQLASEMRFK